MKKINRVIMYVWVILFALTTSAMADAPTSPTDIASTSHTQGVSSTNNEIIVTWTASTDADGDLEGYATKFDNATDTIPLTKTLGATATTTTSAPLDDGANWYFHITAMDSELNISSVAHFGPFAIRTEPTVSSVSPTSGDGGTSVTITGSAFMSGATVKIGTTSMTSVVFVSSTELTATVPSDLNAAAYDIIVTNPNGKGYTLSSAFTVTSGNSAPAVAAGSDKKADTGTSVSFSDATATDADGDTLSYQWIVQSAPDGTTEGTDYSLTLPTSLNGVSFTASAAGAYTLKLTVSDSTVSTSDTVTVTVSEPGATVTPGDPDANGKTDIFDLLTAVDCMTDFSGAGCSACDMDSDGKVDIFDLLGMVDLM